MAGFEDFDDQDWRETLAELRLMVAGAGFSEWDAHAGSALDDNIKGRPNPKMQVIWYSRAFGSFLKVRSARNIRRLREGLGEILFDEENRPVTDAVMVDAYGEHADDVLDDRTSDELLETITAFANAVAGDGGYFDDQEYEQ